MKIIVFCLIFILYDEIGTTNGLDMTVNLVANGTRRILRGRKSDDSEPYMVYLRPADNDPTHPTDPNWLCGGVIIHELYVLTSAACIESIKHFYVISGTNKWIPPNEKNECVTNGAKKAIWKCVPVDYEYDGHQYENVRWMIDDIAVVKVEDKFNFQRRVIGCDYIPQKINFNNVSLEHEKPGTEGIIAGWGSDSHYSDDIKYGKTSFNSPVLMEAAMVIMDKEKCKQGWPDRYHYIIDSTMICAKDDIHTEKMGEFCNDRVKCKEMFNSKEKENGAERRSMYPPANPVVHGSSHRRHSRRFTKSTGGFCENDHGGPLVVGHGTRAMVVGIISACLTSNFTQKCHGPFLFTSVYRNRFLITCAIDREFSPSCRKFVFRASESGMQETTFNWMGHPDGPAKSEVIESKENEKRYKSTSTRKATVLKYVKKQKQ